MIRTRFAPSPNGPLHLGHAYAAVVAHDLARARGGEFLLRIEDIDGERSRSALVEAFFADLDWLGLAWDGEAVVQSRRLADYAEGAEKLRAQGLLYPCQCSRAEIAAAAQAMGPDGPVYPGTCRGRQIDPQGAAWRLDVGAGIMRTGPLTWTDALAGKQPARPDLLGDVVLVRPGLVEVPPGGDIADFVARMVGAGLKVRAVQPERQTLEQLYLEKVLNV